MKILKIKDFSEVTDPVKTEQTIASQLLERETEIESDYAYAMLPLADIINKHGVLNAQGVVDHVQSRYDPAKIFFVCQHILVKNLRFGESLVFTPHATQLDDYIAIPHYSCTYDLEKVKPWEDRQYNYSFMGDFKTHSTRSRLAETFENLPKSIFIDTGSWHFYADQKTQKLNREEYIELLGDTRHSLCPRGTGPSTIRIWESMAMGACPIILSDSLKMPKGSESLWIPQEEDFTGLPCSLGVFDNTPYFNEFSNDNLYKAIYNKIQHKEF